MTTLFFRAAVSTGMVLALAATSPLAIARIHGTITKIDPKRGTFMIHHDPFASMPMSMTMEVEPKRRADLRKLHVGEVIDATVDTTIVPWPGTDIRPGSAPGHVK
jgi:Cu/Ag efflux protein CusF